MNDNVNITSETSLMERFNKRDISAFITIYNHLFTELHIFANKLAYRQSYSPEDSVQEIFCRLWESSHKFNSITQLKAFLYISIKNDYLHYCNHFNVIKKHHIHHQDSFALDESAQTNEQLIKLQEYIEYIPDPGKQILKLYINGYDAKEIAQKMGMNIQTIYNIKSQTISYIRNFFLSKTKTQ